MRLRSWRLACNRVHPLLCALAIDVCVPLLLFLRRRPLRWTKAVTAQTQTTVAQREKSSIAHLDDADEKTACHPRSGPAGWLACQSSTSCDRQRAHRPPSPVQVERHRLGARCRFSDAQGAEGQEVQLRNHVRPWRPRVPAQARPLRVHNAGQRCRGRLVCACACLTLDDVISNTRWFHAGSSSRLFLIDIAFCLMIETRAMHVELVV